jgi:outer membrane protein OmpA-like peptidoglycan-associated protein
VRSESHLSKSISSSTSDNRGLPARSGRNFFLLATAVCGALAFLVNSGAQDYSNLENTPKVEKAKPPTRGINFAAAPDSPATRNYLPHRGVVIVQEVDGTKKEEPYVVLPILFKVDSDDLLDSQSRSNLERLAEFLRRPSLREARFCIEGHTSTEGTHEHNVDLSKRRSNRVFALLIGELAVNPSNLRQEGFGPDAPEVTPELTEQDRRRNRRVVVVREQ